MINVRTAVLDDVELLNELGNNIPEFKVNNTTVTFWPKSVLQSAIQASDVIILVAEDANNIAGFIIANHSEGLKKATIENICVAPEYRNQGIASQLLNSLTTTLIDRRCEYIATLVPNDASEAVGLYVNAGFTEGKEFLWLDKSLGKNFELS